MLALPASGNYPDPEYSDLYHKAIRELVGIIETKHSVHPDRDASAMLQRVIEAGVSDEHSAASQRRHRLDRAYQCIAAARGVGLTAPEFESLLLPVVTLGRIERFSTSTLRTSLEDLLFGQAPAERTRFLNEWPAVIFILGAEPLCNSLLTLFAAHMRLFHHETNNAPQGVRDILLGAPRWRERFCYVDAASDFRNAWEVSKANVQEPFGAHERAQAYAEVRHLLTDQDDPRLVRRICQTIASPFISNSAGLRPILACPGSVPERRLGIFTWASRFEHELARHDHAPSADSARENVRELAGKLEVLAQEMNITSIVAVREAITQLPPSLHRIPLAHRIALVLLHVDLAANTEWTSTLLGSPTFTQVATDAPDRLADFISLVRGVPASHLAELLGHCDEALYRDAFHRNSVQLLLATLPHVGSRSADLKVLMAAVRGYQVEVCGIQPNHDRSGSYKLGVYDLHYGPPERISLNDEFLFAWKFDPRFAATIGHYVHAWLGPAQGASAGHASSVTNPRTEMYHYIHRYLSEHRGFYQTYRVLQGAKLPQATFAFDDSPFPEPPMRTQAYRETFEVMTRNYDLSLRFFTFLECESKRVPGHDESLLERFLRQSFSTYTPLLGSDRNSFPGPGWRIGGLRLKDFGLSIPALRDRFGTHAVGLEYLHDVQLIITQGLVAAWCPTCPETHIDGVPQAWVFYNRHYHPSKDCVGALVDVAQLEHVVTRLERHLPSLNAADLDGHLRPSKKNLAWMGNLSGTLSNAYAFNSGPFTGEAALADRSMIVSEPGGHVHKHYLLRSTNLGTTTFSEERNRFQRAHSELYRAFSALQTLFNVGYLYPFSLFKKGFSVNSLRPQDIDRLWQLDVMDDSSVNPHSLLMLLYAEDVHTAVQRGFIKPQEASMVTYEDPFMLRRDSPKIALDCATMSIGTWNDAGWKEIADLSEFDWPERAAAFTRYFHTAFTSNTLDLKSITRRWIGL